MDAWAVLLALDAAMDQAVAGAGMALDSGLVTTAGVETGTVFFFALLTAIATGLGAIPFFFKKTLSRFWMGVSNATAAGLMIAASFNLIYEGIDSPVMTSSGVLLGLGFILLTHLFLRKHKELKYPHPDAMQGKKMLLILTVMTLHSFTEGVGVGVSFGRGETFGAFITAAIALHNIPEGLAISLILVPRGVSAWKAAGWSIFSSLPQPLMAVPAFLFVELFQEVLPAGLGFAAGAMIWMSISEILPDALKDISANLAAVTVTIAVVFMILFQTLIG
jgi:ZIP family zinc transporter